jgi:hypothetical protein
MNEKAGERNYYPAGAGSWSRAHLNFVSHAGIAMVGQMDISKGVIRADAKNDVLMDDLEISDVMIARKIYYPGITLFVDAR